MANIPTGRMYNNMQFLPTDQIPLPQQGSMTNANLSGQQGEQWKLGLTQENKFGDPNWAHIYGSQLAQAGALGLSEMLGPTDAKAVLDFDRNRDPTLLLPKNPNYSQQAYYGIRADGGLLDEEDDWIFEEDAKPAPKIVDSVKKEVVQAVPDLVDDQENDYSQIREFRKAPQWKSLMEDQPKINGIQEDVSTATQELLTKFPGLRVTSGLRSWGDKDAHPKGRAMDVSGDAKTLAAAADYYKNEIVPKYGFNKALPINHGTGPHIHVGYYEDGGPIVPFVQYTQLNPIEQAQYEQWRTKLPKNLQWEGDYDLKGLWKSNPNVKPSGNMHFPDTYKLPNHPTFSDESIYFNSTTRNNAGHWNENTYVPYDPNVKKSFTEYADGGNVKTSIYDLMESIGQDGSYANRKKLFNDKFEGKYTGTAEQNVALIQMLNHPQQVAPTPTAPNQPTPKPQQISIGSNGMIDRGQGYVPQPTKPLPAKAQVKQAQPVQSTQPSTFQGATFNQGMVVPSGRPYVNLSPGPAPKQAQPKPVPKPPLQSGVVVDKRSNTGYIIQDGQINREFPVLTGKNPDLNRNDYYMSQLEADPSLRNTPVGSYQMRPLIYGSYGASMDMHPIANGAPAPLAKNLMMHKTYDPAVREPLYYQGADKRAVSYGCINCRKPDIQNIMQQFPQGDTLMVMDNKIPEQQRMLSSFKRPRKDDGGITDPVRGYSSTPLANMSDAVGYSLVTGGNPLLHKLGRSLAQDPLGKKLINAVMVHSQNSSYASMSPDDRINSFYSMPSQDPELEAYKQQVRQLAKGSNPATFYASSPYVDVSGRDGALLSQFKKGGWIQKATKNMRKDKPCTGSKFGSSSCPPGSRRYNLAKTFRKMAKKRELGGLVDGQEIDLSEQEIAELKSQGYDFEII